MRARQIQFDRVGQLQLIERELPPLGETQVLVKVNFCGLCTWERYIYQGTETMPFPFVGGHEIAATVVEKGRAVGANIAVGMPCAVAKWVRCNRCEPCRRGFDNHCAANDGPNGRPYSGPGGFSDYLICESYEIFPFDPTAPLHLAALAEPLACVTRAVNRLGVVAGDTVAVTGAGLMGLLFLKLLKLRGCKVLVVQRSPGRRDAALEMGADWAVGPEDWVRFSQTAAGGTGLAAAVYTAGGSWMINQCLQAVRVGGTVMQYAPTHEERPAADLDLVHVKELVFTGAIRHDKESFRQAVRLLGSSLADFSDLSLHRGSFLRLEEEMARAEQERDTHRILLCWEEDA